MPKITKLMVREFKIREYGYDFMGYHLNQGDKLTFHHLVVARRDGGPYARWNGAIIMWRIVTSIFAHNRKKGP